MEEGEKRRQCDSDDRQRAEVDKYSHPLSINSDANNNIVNSQVATDEVNGSSAIFIGELVTRWQVRFATPVWIQSLDFH